MYDTFSIIRNGKAHEGRRFLREDRGRTFQTVFYLYMTRCDPTGYAQFASDDPAMNASAHAMLATMVDEAAKCRHRPF